MVVNSFASHKGMGREFKIKRSLGLLDWYQDSAAVRLECYIYLHPMWKRNISTAVIASLLFMFKIIRFLGFLDW
jgi:hypothetical protein